MELHYILVVLVILAIIIAQISIYRNTKKKISTYKSIFPNSKSSYSIVEMAIQTNNTTNNETNKDGDDYEDIETISVSQIKIKTSNSTLVEIRNALNMYLQKNKGAASDFYLMKDVVERYCDAEEEEINIQQPIPLYLGLMGTMVGIIVGIGFIAVSGGLSSENLMGNITSLMTCVAIAMAASLVGICCTTMISWASKSATSKVEADKNRFYSWLQTELLPVLSGNAVNALYLLQQNLMTFNQTFQSNIEGLSGALSKVEASSKEQVQLITLIKDIDIKRVAQANVTVLKELKECTGEIAVFNQYLHNVSNYLHSVNELNSNINEHLNRTAVIEKLGIFFEKEINQVAAREQYINEVVANVDNTLQKSFIKISENTKEVVTSLQNNSVSEFDALLKHYAKQKEEFSQMLQEQREEFIARNAETIELMKEIRNLADTKVVMNQLVETTKGQSAILEKLANSLKNQNVTSGGFREAEYGNDKGIVTPAFPKSIVYMVATITALAFMSFGLYAYNTFIEKSKVKPKAAKVVTTKAPVVKSNEIQKDQVDTTEIVDTANTSK